MGSSSAWVSRKRRAKRPTEEKTNTLVVINPFFFAKRNKNGQAPPNPEWSESMLRQAAEKWPKILIFFPLESPEMVEDGLAEKLYRFTRDLKLSNINIVTYSRTDPISATKVWREAIRSVGGTIVSPKNPREVTYLNMEKHTHASHITWVDLDDHEKLGVEIDKPKSFSDFQKVRKRSAGW
jgi:hypothetical protein